MHFIRTVVTFGAHLGVVPELKPVALAMVRLAGLTDRYSMPHFAALLRQEIARQPPQGCGTDMMSRLASLHRQDTATAGHETSPDTAFQAAWATIPPAAHTTAFAVDMVLYEVFRTPRVLQKLREEVQDIRPQGKYHPMNLYLRDAFLTFFRSGLERRCKMYDLHKSCDSGDAPIASTYQSGP